MTEKEIAELRRRFRADKSNISHVRGCYVNENREIISEFEQSLALMGQERVKSCWRFCGRLFPGLREKISWTSRLTPGRWWRATSTSC